MPRKFTRYAADERTVSHHVGRDGEPIFSAAVPDASSMCCVGQPQGWLAAADPGARLHVRRCLHCRFSFLVEPL